MTSKREQGEDVFAEYQQAPSDAQNLPLFAASAFILSILPAYLYWAVFDMNLTEYGIEFAAVFAGSVACLFLAYRNVARNTAIKLQKEKVVKKPKKGGKDEDAPKPYSVAEEAAWWSLFFNNMVFLLAFTFIGFYALRQVAIGYNYATAVGVSSVLVWQLS